MTSFRHEGGKFRRSSLSTRRSNVAAALAREPLLDGQEVDEEAAPGAPQQQVQGRRGRSRALDEEKPPSTGWSGEYVKSIVYGGLDAIVTSFALVASVSGGDLPAGAVLVLGFANLIADGISMGYGDFLSSTAERDFAANEQQVADWLMEHELHEEMLDLVSAYEDRGMEKQDADKVVEIISKYKDIIADHKLTMRQGLLPPDPEDSPLKNGLVTFISFLCFGSLPLLSYLVLSPFTINKDYKFTGACFVTLLALILLGVAKAGVSGQKYLNSAAVVVFNGGIAAAAAYAISYILNDVFGIDE